MERELTPSESLKLIETMISQAKRSFHRQSFYFLLWGVLLIAAMLFNYVMVVMGSDLGGFAWPAVGIGGGILSFIHGSKADRTKVVATATDRVIMWLWMGFVVTMLITLFASTDGEESKAIATIIVLTGLPTFVTGQLMRFKPLIFGGILFWFFGAVSYFAPMSVTAWLFIAAILFGYLLPGYLLKRQEDGLRTP